MNYLLGRKDWFRGHGESSSYDRGRGGNGKEGVLNNRGEGVRFTASRLSKSHRNLFSTKGKKRRPLRKRENLIHPLGAHAR